MKILSVMKSNRELLKMILLVVISATCFYVSFTFAQVGIEHMAERITGTFGAIARLVTAGSYVAGLGFAIAAILKFKAHKDNPTQIPIGTPVALLFVAAALLFLPTLFKAIGVSVFGSGAQEAGISGVTSLG
jgi:intracellular multiplication protein IcmD